MCNYINADGDCLLDLVACHKDTSKPCEAADEYVEWRNKKEGNE